MVAPVTLVIVLRDAVGVLIDDFVPVAVADPDLELRGGGGGARS